MTSGEWIDYLHTIGFVVAMYYAYSAHIVSKESKQISERTIQMLDRLTAKLEK